MVVWDVTDGHTRDKTLIIAVRAEQDIRSVYLVSSHFIDHKVQTEPWHLLT